MQHDDGEDFLLVLYWITIGPTELGMLYVCSMKGRKYIATYHVCMCIVSYYLYALILIMNVFIIILSVHGNPPNKNISIHSYIHMIHTYIHTCTSTHITLTYKSPYPILLSIGPLLCPIDNHAQTLIFLFFLLVYHLYSPHTEIHS